MGLKETQSSPFTMLLFVMETPGWLLEWKGMVGMVGVGEWHTAAAVDVPSVGVLGLAAVGLD